jgi:hypothetical protein
MKVVTIAMRDIVQNLKDGNKRYQENKMQNRYTFLYGNPKPETAPSILPAGFMIWISMPLNG